MSVKMSGNLSLDALQRISYEPDFTQAQQEAPVAASAMFTLAEFGVEMTDARHTEPRRLQTTVFGAAAAGAGAAPQELPRLASLLVGAHGVGTGISFGVTSAGGRISVHSGHFQRNAKSTTAIGRALMLRLLRSHVAPVRAHAAAAATWTGFERGGLALGIPLPQSEVGTAGRPVDRLIRALIGSTWGYQVLAEPIASAGITKLRDLVLAEIRRADAARAAAGVTDPQAQRYVDLLQASLHDLSLGAALGLWRTATYLLASESNFQELAALWRGLYSEGGISREPIRIAEDTVVLDWARRQAMPLGPSVEMFNPFPFQSLLTSHQLAHLVDLPSQEAPGIIIRKYARFDTAPTIGAVADRSALVGHIDYAGVQTEPYRIDLNSLTRHVFVAGVTGAGKTNTMVHILRQLHEHGIPFLVLEPAKSEYRALQADGVLKDALSIYTVGDERTAPIRINPFEVVGWPATSVSVHIDLLRSCFAASFGLWSPLPQILEQCLHEVYRDEGWDPVTNTNHRLGPGDDPFQAFPTLTALAEKVDTYIHTLGYDDRVRADLRAALLTRVNGLRVGGKGAMFDTRASMSMAALLASPCVLELQNLGDDDDKAFLMALLFIRLVEHRRSTVSGRELSHLLVIEEAHRLLTNTGGKSGNPEQADPRGKAIETFGNLISEIRAYGQGIAIVDQVPTKLAPDVIKNTNLKIAHRIVAIDDREVLAGAMAMNPQQTAALATFGVGVVAVFQDGEDAPLLLSVPAVKDNLGTSPTDADVRVLMRARQGSPDLAVPAGPHPWCTSTCGGAGACQVPDTSDPLLLQAYSKVVVSALGDPMSLRDRLAAFARTASMRLGSALTQRQLVCLCSTLGGRLARRWGAPLMAEHGKAQRFAEALANACSESLNTGVRASTAKEFRDAARTLLGDAYPDFCSACQLVRERFGDTQPCFSRAAVLSAVNDGKILSRLSEALNGDFADADPTLGRTSQVVNDAAYELIDFPDETSAAPLGEGSRARRCLFCVAFHGMVAARPWDHGRVGAELAKLARRFEPTPE
ncbi:ATP-binding protein [Massilia sp. TSP1-1-2]|uniref:ATP-binding protein n=1 Tax=unclassified Massilia TaxID=2609279 RepID=UPI003CF2E211